LQNSQRFVIELKSSADTVLSSLSEELWVCHCALMASCCLVMYDKNTVVSSALVPRLHSSISSAAKSLPEDEPKYSNPSFCVITDAVDHASLSAFGVPPSTMRSVSPVDLPSSRAATLRSAPSGPMADSAAKQKQLSPREQLFRFPSNIPTRLPSNLPVEPLSVGSVSNGNEFRPTRNINAHESEVNAIAISVDRASLFSAGNDRSIKKWQLDRCFCIKSVLLDHEVTCLAISSDGKNSRSLSVVTV
jgi:WD40 repeat protein